MSADNFGIYDVPYEEGSERGREAYSEDTNSKIPLGLKYGVLFCRGLQKMIPAKPKESVTIDFLKIACCIRSNLRKFLEKIQVLLSCAVYFSRI